MTTLFRFTIISFILWSAGVCFGASAPGVMLRIDIRHSNSNIGNAIPTGNHSAAESKRSPGHWGTGRKSVMQHILVQNGEEAFIVEGEDIPYNSEISMLNGRHQGYGKRISYKKVRTGFQVRPTLQGDSITVEVVALHEDTRRSSRHGEDTPPSIVYEKTATTLRIPINSWFKLGATKKLSEQDRGDATRWSTGKDYENREVWIKIGKFSPQRSPDNIGSVQ